MPTCLRNLSAHSNRSACTKAIIGKVTPINQVLAVVLLPMEDPQKSLPPMATRKDGILEELNLQGLEEWSGAEQETGQEAAA